MISLRSENRFDSTTHSAKSRVLTSASAIALMVATSIAGTSAALAAETAPQTAQAAPQSAQDTAQAPAVEEVVVTGTRIIRDGYEAPTPVSVLGSAELNSMAVTNVSEAVNRLPSFERSTTDTNSATADVTGGIQNLNLRGLQPVRTLVLLDGKRVVGSTLSGFNNNGSAVDINIMPNNLISRVDVVTGGASAVYGSDALAGVVNFVLDKNFTGVKGNVEGGITTYGDDAKYEISLAAGIPFANDRGHFLLSGEYAYTAGIAHNDRPWANQSYSLIVNPAYAAGNGKPQYIAVFDTGLATATPGGLITSGPLKGTMFLAGGSPSTFNYGSLVSGSLMSGGDWQISRIDTDGSPDLRLQRDNAYSRLSYELTDNLTAYVETQWAYTHSRAIDGVPYFHLGNVTVKSDNAYLPATIKAEMTALNLTSFTLGTTNADEPPFLANNRRTFRRWAGGLEGKFDAFDTTWSWQAYAQRSMTGVDATTPSDEIEANYTLAADAVVSPTTGQIVCRSNLTGGNPACVPYDVMGIGVNTAKNLSYIDGMGYTYIDLTQDVEEATATGEPFSSWAGPISVALGAQHRKESVNSISSAIDQAKGFFAGNFTASVGHFEVTEGSIETVIPLAKDTAWAKSLDLNAAARATDYTVSGYVTTWKVGATYKPIDDLTFRATQSRDIRAPNLGDLYSAGRSGTGTVTENGFVSTVVSRVSGNTALQPEKADTTGLGVVAQPSFIPGFGASVDFYNININNAIVSLAAQNYVDLCDQGNTAFCSFIQRDANGHVNFVAIEPANFQAQKARGIDFEASYNIHLDSIVSSWDGAVTLRALATHVISLETIGLGTTVQGAGVVADAAGIGTTGLFAPHWKYMISAGYSLDAFTGTVTMRGTGSGVYNNALIACTSGCPTSTSANPTIDNNHIAGNSVFDLALNYKVFGGSEVYFTVQNLFNTWPPLIAAASTTGYYAGQGNSEYDRIGRTFLMGVRFKY